VVLHCGTLSVPTDSPAILAKASMSMVVRVNLVESALALLKARYWAREVQSTALHVRYSVVGASAVLAALFGRPVFTNI